MRILTILLSLSLFACQIDNRIDLSCDINEIESQYLTTSDKPISYRYTKVYRAYNATRIRPKLEPDDSDFVTYKVYRGDGFISLGDYMIIPENIFEVSNWEARGVKCMREKLYRKKQDIIVDAVCVLNPTRGKLQFTYSYEKGVIRVKESCETCDANDEEHLVSKYGILRPCFK